MFWRPVEPLIRTLSVNVQTGCDYKSFNGVFDQRIHKDRSAKSVGCRVRPDIHHALPYAHNSSQMTNDFDSPESTLHCFRILDITNDEVGSRIEIAGPSLSRSMDRGRKV